MIKQFHRRARRGGLLALALSLPLAGLLPACGESSSDPLPGLPLGVPGGDGGALDPHDGGSDAVAGQITVTSPQAGGRYRGSVALAFTVATGTTLPASPKAAVGGVSLEVTPGDTAGAWKATITSAKLAPAPTGQQLLRISAQDSAGTPLSTTVSFTFDDQGPTIADAKPVSDFITGGMVRISARVTDPAGVGTRVTAFIGNRAGLGFEVPLEPDPSGGDVYASSFDTRALTSCGVATPNALCVVYPNLSFRAVDRLGNESLLAYDIPIDNQPPVADLDPGPIRLLKPDAEGHPICSQSFDPVGNYRQLGDMPNDGCGVGQLFDLRAHIEDRGNDGTGSKGSPISLVDPASVVAYVLDDTSQALAIDSNGDGICDDVNPLLVPTTTPTTQAGQVLAVRLRGIVPAGMGDYTPSTDIPGTCESGKEMVPPALYCGADGSVPVALGYPAPHSPEPAIWTVDPLNPVFCSGGQFDVHANQIGDGWACIAVVAVDHVGNRSISQPLRVYVDRQLTRIAGGGPNCPAPPADDRVPPDCTGRFDRATKQVTATPCKSPRMAGSVRREK
jgi:hypothetical protein